MNKQFCLADLKGAPLSIMVYLSMCGNRAVTITDLLETGYTPKPIRAGLKILEDLGIIVEPRNNRYQLTGPDCQLPLSWGEIMVPAGETPEKEGDFPSLEKRVALLEHAVFGTGKGETPQIQGDFPQCGRYSLMSGEIKKGNIPQIQGETPLKEGEIPHVLINNINNPMVKEVSKLVRKDTNLLNKSTEVNSLTPAGNFPGIQGETPEHEIRWRAVMQQMETLMGKPTFATMLKNAEIIGYEDGHYMIGVKNSMVRDWVDQRCRDQIEGMLSRMNYGPQTVSFVVMAVASDANCGDSPLTATVPCEAPSLELLPGTGELVEICNDYLLDPTGIEYSREQLKMLISMNPDPAVLRFVLPRMSTFDSAKVWCGWNLKTARMKLLTKYQIIGAARAEISNNDQVTLELIEEQCRQHCPENAGLAIDRILEYAKAGEIPE